VGFFKEFWSFLKVRKKFWLLPLIAVLGLIGGILIFAQGSAVAPFIYTLF
jgi:paraquat-inducible protein B